MSHPSYSEREFYYLCNACGHESKEAYSSQDAFEIIRCCKECKSDDLQWEEN